MLQVGWAGPHLPDIQQVVLLLAYEVGVEQQVAVATVEMAQPLGLHRHQLQVLDAPHLEPESILTEVQNGFHHPLPTNVSSTVSHSPALPRSHHPPFSAGQPPEAVHAWTEHQTSPVPPWLER